MSKYAFPAIFRWDEGEQVYDVTFPDIENCFTAGENQPEALENAADALALILCDMEDEHAAIPLPAHLDTLSAGEKGFVSLVAADTDAYREIIERENNPIKHARKQAGLNIKMLAELLGAPYRTVQEWNAGRRLPPPWVQRLIVEKIEANA